MNQHREDQVRRRAYEIWESEGRPAGCEDRHWQQAQAEVGGDGQAGGWVGDPPQADPPRAAGESAPGALEADLGTTPGPTSGMDRDLAGPPGATSTFDAGPTPGPTSTAPRSRRVG